MIEFVGIGADNLNGALALTVREEQRRFVPAPEGILARAWAHRDDGARVFGIQYEGRLAGLILVYELKEEPACYCLMEMLVDQRYQKRGIAGEALRRIVDLYARNPRYPMIELSVDRENAGAIRVYERAGFVDSGYTDPEYPQYINMVYRFSPVPNE